MSFPVAVLGALVSWWPTPLPFNQKSEIRNQKFAPSFTLIEMLVVIGIILLIAAISLPAFLAMTKGGRLRQAGDTVTSACLVARSRAIRERRKISVTLLEREKCVLINDYSLLENILPLVEADTCQDSTVTTLERKAGNTADWTGYYVTLAKGNGIGQQRLIKEAPDETLDLDVDWVETTITGWTCPEADGEYLIGGKTAKAVCPHLLSNFDCDLSNLPDFAAQEPTSPTSIGKREYILKALAIGGVRLLPEGVALDLDDDSATYDPRDPQPHAWTWIFLPTGGVITLDTEASNQRDEHWHETTYMKDNKPAGPRLYGPQDEDSIRIIVYAMTGQAQSK